MAIISSVRSEERAGTSSEGKDVAVMLGGGGAHPPGQQRGKGRREEVASRRTAMRIVAIGLAVRRAGDR